MIKFFKLEGQNIQLRYELCKDLEKHFKKFLKNEGILFKIKIIYFLFNLHLLFIEISLSLFGSTSNGLATKESDMDMTLTFKNNPVFLEDVEQIRNISKILEEFNGITKLSTILNARCPVVRFFHEKLNVYCDISIDN